MKKSLRLIAPAMAFSILFFIHDLKASAAEDYATWQQSSTLYLNTSTDGANSGTVLNFPLLVRLDTFDFSQALGDGHDIRFSKPDGTPLAFEIDHWDSVGKSAFIWVKMDTVYGLSKTQTVKMFWGKANAPEIASSNTVFDSASGFMSVWHMGGIGTAARRNAVPGGLGAMPINFEGDENRRGLIGLADSMDADTAKGGEYFDLGDGYANFTSGFSYSVWSYASSATNYAKLIDLGNGGGKDNLSLMRVASTNDLAFRIYNNTDSARRLTAPAALAQNVWQYFSIIVEGKVLRLYRNGELIKTDTVLVAPSNVQRNSNFIGRSNWSGNATFVGKLDEAVLAKVARSADWVRLSYANQKLGQNVVSFSKPSACQAAFSVPADTTVSERSSLILAISASCSQGFYWSVESGPAPRILDPEVKNLQVFIPRISRDTVYVYTIKALFPSGDQSKQIRVTVKDMIPDPTFTLPASMSWVGNDSLVIKGTVTNLATIKASVDSILNWRWEILEGDVDTLWHTDALVLKKNNSGGPILVKACLDNGGPETCKSIPIETPTTSAFKRLKPTFPLKGRKPVRDLLGRLMEKIFRGF